MMMIFFAKMNEAIPRFQANHNSHKKSEKKQAMNDIKHCTMKGVTAFLAYIKYEECDVIHI